jgi:hypothetical protein
MGGEIRLPSSLDSLSDTFHRLTCPVDLRSAEFTSRMAAYKTAEKPGALDVHVHFGSVLTNLTPMLSLHSGFYDSLSYIPMLYDLP